MNSLNDQSLGRRSFLLADSVSTPDEALGDQQNTAKIPRIKNGNILNVLTRRNVIATYGKLTSVKATIEFFRELSLDADSEFMAILYLDETFAVLRCDVKPGDYSSVEIPSREIISSSFSAASKAVILLHNHPSGCTQPSRDDKLATRVASDVLEYVGITLVDHVIVSGMRTVFSFRATGYL